MSRDEKRIDRWQRRIAKVVGKNAAFMLLLVGALLVGGVPVLLSLTAPELNNAVLIAICASGQFFISVFVGIAWSKTQAQKEANMRWVPMAASACDRLATILGSVSSLRAAVGQACAAASTNLPELKENKNRAVRVHFEGLCSSNATRLQDVESHLDSALTDWERFIKQNCDGPECADIGRRLAILRSRLSSADQSAGSACATQSIVTLAVQGSPPSATIQPDVTDSIELAVFGVTTRPNRNGRWALRQVEEGCWEGATYVLRRESHGWYLEDKEDATDYFFREGTDTQFGVYERCGVCPDDGSAIVSRGSVKHTAATTPVSDVASGQDQAMRFVGLVVQLDRWIQHGMESHGLRKDVVIAALLSAKSMREYSAILGTNCPDVVSLCAMSGINSIRDFFSLPPLEYDAALWEELRPKEEAHASVTHDEKVEDSEVDSLP
jgi:hypothetical protein